MEKYTECAPGVTCVEACSSPVAPPFPPSPFPSNAVPLPLPADMPPRPVELILTTLPEPSKAKLSGAEIAEPLVVHVELSSSAIKASLYDEATKCGYSSDRNL